jgi:hypothetical protein
LSFVALLAKNSDVNLFCSIEEPLKREFDESKGYFLSLRTIPYTTEVLEEDENDEQIETK